MTQPPDEPIARPPFELDVEPGGDGRVQVRVAGELDMATAGRLSGAVREHAAEGRDRVLLRLEDVSFMDSTGLGTLLELCQEVAAMSIVASEPVRKVISLVRLEDQLGLSSSVDEARERLGA